MVSFSAGLIDLIVAGAVLDAAIVVIALLICRITGRRIPSWVPFSEKLNRWIEPDEYRFKRIRSPPWAA